MKETKEISALLSLIDDPDMEVSGHVHEKLVSYGTDIIPILENYWASTPNTEVQQKVEEMINHLQFRLLTGQFEQWCLKPFDLMEAAIIISKIKFPDLAERDLWAQFEKIRRNIWIELNSYLTPVEQINIINSIIFNFFNLRNSELPSDEKSYFVSHLLESKKGNVISLGLLYLALCKKLDVPVHFVEVPHHFILAYCNSPALPGINDEETNEIKFFINPGSGQLYTLKDVEAYYNKIGEPFATENLVCRNNVFTVHKTLKELERFYLETDAQKAADLKQLTAILVQQHPELPS